MLASKTNFFKLFVWNVIYLPYKLDTFFYWESASSLLNKMKNFQISLIAPLVLWDINSREM